MLSRDPEELTLAVYALTGAILLSARITEEEFVTATGNPEMLKIAATYLKMRMPTPNDTAH